MTRLSLVLLVMIMLPDSYHQKWFPHIFFHINIYDEGAAFPFAHISWNESLYTLQYFTSHGPARTQHPARLLWTSTGSTSFPLAHRTAIWNPSAAFQGPKFWPSQKRWSWKWGGRTRGSKGKHCSVLLCAPWDPGHTRLCLEAYCSLQK